ncbi:phosphoadenosine phosphosulfate reductase, partial [Alcaligenes pakistanensis]
MPAQAPAALALSARPLMLWKQLRDDLQLIAREHADAVLASSLAAEDMVLFHAMSIYTPDLQTITLNTGRLHEETL